MKKKVGPLEEAKKDKIVLGHHAPRVLRRGVRGGRGGQHSFDGLGGDRCRRL